MAREFEFNLPPADDLFSTQEERDVAKLEKVMELPISEIDDFPDHPFKVRLDKKMQETIESIEQHGVLVPALVRPKVGGRYEMIAGHRRKFGSTEAGRDTMPCIVRNLTDDEATIVMVDSNLQREEILPSEKAFAYKMRLDAMKRQAGRPSKDNYSPVANNLPKTSSEELAEAVGTSKDTIFRYIRLTHLVPELLEMVHNAARAEKDQPQIALRPAVELSYLPEEAQMWIVQAIAMEAATPSHAQTLKMRKFLDDGKLNEGVILSILQEEKPNQVEKIKIPHEKVSRFFDEGTPPEKIMEVIVEALEMRQRKLERDRQRKAQERGAR